MSVGNVPAIRPPVMTVPNSTTTQPMSASVPLVLLYVKSSHDLPVFTDTPRLYVFEPSLGMRTTEFVCTDDAVYSTTCHSTQLSGWQAESRRFVAVVIVARMKSSQLYAAPSSV